MKVKDIMSHNVFVVQSDARVRDVAKMMLDRKLGSAVVSDGARVVGIITDRDVLATMTNKKTFDPDREVVESIMSRGVHFIGAEADVWKAKDMMLRYGVKKLPVMKDGRLGGIVTSTDIAAEESDVVDSLKSAAHRAVRGY